MLAAVAILAGCEAGPPDSVLRALSADPCKQSVEPQLTELPDLAVEADVARLDFSSDSAGRCDVLLAADEVADRNDAGDKLYDLRGNCRVRMGKREFHADSAQVRVTTSRDGSRIVRRFEIVLSGHIHVRGARFAGVRADQAVVCLATTGQAFAVTNARLRRLGK